MKYCSEIENYECKLQNITQYLNFPRYCAILGPVERRNRNLNYASNGHTKTISHTSAVRCLISIIGQLSVKKIESFQNTRKKESKLTGCHILILSRLIFEDIICY